MPSRIFDIQVIIPSLPIKNFLYWCDREFKLDQLKVLEEKKDYNIGAICVNGESSKFYFISQPDSLGYIDSKHLQTLEVYLPKGHRKGGQSAPRFQRMYLSALDAYIKKVIDLSLELFRVNGSPIVKKILVTGNGIRVKHLTDQLEKEFKVDIQGYSVATITELIVIPGISSISNDLILDRLKEMVANGSELLCFGDHLKRDFSQLEKVYTRDPSIFPENSKVIKLDHPWLDQFGGSLGLYYYSEKSCDKSVN